MTAFSPNFMEGSGSEQVQYRPHAETSVSIIKTIEFQTIIT
jgi:hypothetical protein